MPAGYATGSRRRPSGTDNPNLVPLSTNPEVKVRYNWTAYDAFDAREAWCGQMSLKRNGATSSRAFSCRPTGSSVLRDWLVMWISACESLRCQGQAA